MEEVAVTKQSAPYPWKLKRLVDACTYRNNWTVHLTDENFDRGQESYGLTLVISPETVNSYNQSQPLRVNHYFTVPPAAYNEQSWQRWLFECFHQVELHECMEFFSIDGNKPFAPNHGPGHDPYTVHQYSTDIDRRTSFRGDVNAH